MTDDAWLIRRFIREGSQPAFTELVERHIGLVHAAAMRRCGDPHAADDATQRVFTALARQAASLESRPSLTGWLYVATRNVCIDLIRAESRRRHRELEAALLNPPQTSE